MPDTGENHKVAPSLEGWPALVSRFFGETGRGLGLENEINLPWKFRPPWHSKERRDEAGAPRYFLAADCLRRRASCSLSSGVSSAPKSSASNTWRISISAPPSKGLRLSHSTASSIDLTCHSQKPAISSLLSVNGPSMMVCFPPENRTRLPFEVGCSPSPASITPAFTSSSLNFPIAVRSSRLGITPASLFLSALTITMNRIVLSPRYDFMIWSRASRLYLDVEREAGGSTLATLISEMVRVLHQGRLTGLLPRP